MAKFAQFTSNGFPVAFYSEDVHGDKVRQVFETVEEDDGEGGKTISQKPVGTEPNPDCTIPTDAIAITDDQWMEFLNFQGCRRWDGSAVVVYAPPAPTPEQVRAAMPSLSPVQFRVGLVNAGFSPAAVQAAIEALPAGVEREKALIEWEYATSFDRMHPLIASIGGALGLSEEQIDAMWMAAITSKQGTSE